MVAALLLVDVPSASAAPKPSVALSPTSGPPGTQVTVTGQNWPAGHTISISFPDRGFWGPGSTTSNSDGSFTFSFAWPSPSAPGEHQVAVIDNTGPVDGPPYPIFTVTPEPDSTPPASKLTVDRAYVANSSWAETTQVNPGDIVRYQVVIAASDTAVVNVRMRVTGKEGQAIFDGGGDVNVSASDGSVFFESAIPPDARSGTYTQTATVIHNGVTTVRTSSFAVAGPSRGPASNEVEGVAQVLMPFSGRFANEAFKETAPGKHPHYWSGMQWATDIYAVPGTPVKANFSGNGISLKVINVGGIPDCFSDSNKTVKVSAGSYVTVSVSVNGQNIGSVHYQHLDVVDLKAGAEISNGATLGITHMWTKSNCWQVNNDAGVHTHLEVGSKSGTACYMAHARGSKLGESDMIGGLRKEGYTTLECPKRL